jgi:hypothetical protein
MKTKYFNFGPILVLHLNFVLHTGAFRIIFLGHAHPSCIGFKASSESSSFSFSDSFWHASARQFSHTIKKCSEVTMTADKHCPFRHHENPPMFAHGTGPATPAASAPIHERTLLKATGPPPLPLVGNLLDFLRHGDLATMLAAHAAAYGPLSVAHLNGRPVFFASHPDLVKEACAPFKTPSPSVHPPTRQLF